MLHDLVAARVSRALARERVSAALQLMTSVLATRARTVAAGRRPALGRRAFEENLVAMVVGLLNAPA
jgi:hypothetical protein